MAVAEKGRRSGCPPPEKKLWIIPAERMNSGKEHRVPLADRALELTGHDSGSYLFPGYLQDRPFNEGAMLKLLKRMGFDELTVHGFRSTFKDWARDRTGFEAHWLIHKAIRLKPLMPAAT